MKVTVLEPGGMRTDLLGTDAVPMAWQAAQELAASDEAWRDIRSRFGSCTFGRHDPSSTRRVSSTLGALRLRFDCNNGATPGE